MPKALSPIESFLAPLAKLAAKHPEMEAEVIWSTATGWEPQADTEAMPDALMDAEEAPFYAEGLLMEGFTVTYQVLAEAESPKLPVHIRLFCSQPGPESGSPTAPPPEDGLTLLATGRWPQ